MGVAVEPAVVFLACLLEFLKELPWQQAYDRNRLEANWFFPQYVFTSYSPAIYRKNLSPLKYYGGYHITVEISATCGE